MPRRQNRELRREDLAKAALRVIARKGLAAATVREVAREAGCSPGLITHYAKTMDELLLAAAAYSTVEAKERILPVVEKLEGLEGIRRMALESLPLNADRIDAWKLWISFWDMSRPHARIRKVLDEHIVGQRRWYKNLILSARNLKEIAADVNPTEAADNLIIFLHGIGVVGALQPSFMPPRKQKLFLEDWIEKTLRPK